MSNAPRRRWFQFSLRTLFVVMTLLALWLAYSLDWIRQRREFLELSNVVGYAGPQNNRPRAPGLLWLLGERAYLWLWVSSEGSGGEYEAKRLFPEADWSNPFPTDFGGLDIPFRRE